MNVQFRKKFSASIVAMMLLSMLMPVLSHAAAYITFYYNAERGTLAGGIYTADYDNVKIERIDEDGTVEVLNGAVSPYSVTDYDDNNVPYKWVDYSEISIADTTKEIKVTEGKDNKIYILPRGENGFYSNPGDSVPLDVYRMKGLEFYSQHKENTYLGNGDKLLSFVPEESGHDAIEIELPIEYGNGGNAIFNSAAAVGSDFELTDATVSQSVYATEAFPSSWYNHEQEKYIYQDYSFILQFKEPLIKGHTYEVRLSSTSGGDEIKLPKAGNNYNASLRYGYYSSYKDWQTGKDIYYFSSINLSKFNNISIASETTTNNPGPGSGGGGVVVTPVADEGKQIVELDSLKNAKDGIVNVAISKDKPQVVLPVKAAEAVGDSKLRLDSESLTVDIPSKVLAKLQQLLPADQLEGAQIVFDFKTVSGAAATDLLSKASAQSLAAVTAAGEIYDFSLSVVGKDGKVTTLSQFEEPITISLKVNEKANQALVGVYYISDSGKLEFVSGKTVGGEIQVEISHFSKYAVLEYNKTFTDVAAGFWASDIIKALSAKHVIQGVSETSFAPQADVTRAEFAAMLTRALGLKASGTASFTDVNSGAWYAEAVAAASQAGIVQGTSSTTFSPNAKITREEMSALLVRAYELKTGKKLAAAKISEFADRGQASAWALAYIDAAYEAGFVQGRDDNQFAPKAKLTRAESAKAIYTLLVE
ncbi:S-layer homology domain-containing protein [Paenibacillus luteus]|uniref:S-layer homology domain-containing protein n=1 Tax=Paenibacillus luteus TaxID=2545753 RepID=UPI001142E7EC|nr:S-layer homology domain-containing protein [Paenibacillus luteus]